MKTKIVLTIALLLTVISSAYAQTSYSFADGLNKAKSQNKKVLINIFSESNAWSQKMDLIYALDNIRNYVNSNFIYVKLNAGGSEKISYGGKDYTAASLAKFLGATGYPTHVFLNPDGGIILFKYNGESTGAFPGYVEAGDFEKILKFFAENIYTNTDLSKVM
ncbi:MAG: DUF255 domain-containing protein [Ignavibacteriae bacterium]|jgi:thioredoxin-related protein|nr:DUF255 domain-containing protein [Ignavibacteriota bacterium]